MLWEPDEVLHEMPVLYFHGGAYVFGSPESMIDAANVYNARGYRFCSVGFREAPWHKFPDMVDDGFLGAKAALAYMEQADIPCNRIAVGGTSAGLNVWKRTSDGRKLSEIWKTYRMRRR